MTNAIKHAQAHHISVALTCTGHALELAVQDDGIGLPAAWQRPGHHGLLGIRERVQALGGTLTLSAAQPAAPRPGLRLSAALPWSQSPVSGT